MALLFFWQFVTAAVHSVDRKSALSALLWPSHRPVGLALLALACLRVLWALVRSCKSSTFCVITTTL